MSIIEQDNWVAVCYMGVEMYHVNVSASGPLGIKFQVKKDAIRMQSPENYTNLACALS